ncbi:MAG: HEAT repeat domain-containing protein, partial [Deferrisomatales bacterium]
PRPAFELEQVLPGADPDDPFSDPILESNECKEAGDHAGARRLLMDLCQADLRCLDAHAHLGNLAFEHWPDQALRHYAVGVGIGELSLGPGFDGVLPWGNLDNRPFLRCLQGYGLCLWRLGRADEAARVFERMLWLNPWDNQGVRGLLRPCRAGESWPPEEEREAGGHGGRRDLEALADLPPWEWPGDAPARFREVLEDPAASPADRLLAARLAGDTGAMDDGLAEVLLAIAADGREPEALRGQAAIALGPALELGDPEGFGDSAAAPLSAAVFRRSREVLRRLYQDPGAPKRVRRQALEASVRAPDGWHQGAVRAALASGDPEWRLTAVFCTRWLPGFDQAIVTALESDDPNLVHHALRAAGSWGVAGAWPAVAALLEDPGTPKELLLAAIDAAVNVNPEEAGELLDLWLDDEDDDVAEAAYEALAIIEALGDDDWDGDEPYH